MITTRVVLHAEEVEASEDVEVELDADGYATVRFKDGGTLVAVYGTATAVRQMLNRATDGVVSAEARHLAADRAESERCRLEDEAREAADDRPWVESDGGF